MIIKIAIVFILSISLTVLSCWVDSKKKKKEDKEND